MTADAITEEVRALERLDLEGLRAVWRGRFGSPPTLRSPALVKRMLAWRIQIAAFGGLDADTRRRLKQSSPVKPVTPAPTPGTRISREWQGKVHEVSVLPDGFCYNGRQFKSLSEVARTITGARWNGPRFFGLRATVAV
jgi:hypothetical protein